MYFFFPGIVYYLLTHSFSKGGKKNTASEKKIPLFTHSLDFSLKMSKNKLFQVKKIRYLCVGVGEVEDDSVAVGLVFAAGASMEWMPISYLPLRTPSRVPEITCEMRALTFEQYVFVRRWLRAQPMLMGRTSFRCSLYKTISLDSAVSSPSYRQ